MKQVLLDTNFILTCMGQKIDFFEELTGVEILIPKQVIKEIKKITESKKKLKFKEAANLSLQLLEKNPYKEIEISGSYADKAIIKYAEENKKTIIATLDREIKRSISNPKLVIRGKKKLEVV